MNGREFVRRHVFHNLGLKIVSLLIAIALWLAVSNEPPSEAAVNVAIVFRNMPEDLEISSENIPSAQVRVRGPERLVRQLQPSDVHAEIDLTGMKPGERTFDLAAQQIHQPSELEVVQVVPSQFHLTFDTRLTRQVPVQPRIARTFASGYALERVEVDPPAITITGPKKHVEAVESAITDPLDLSGAINRATFVRHAYVSDPLVQVASPDPVRVTVIMQKVPIPGGGAQSAKPE